MKQDDKFDHMINCRYKNITISKFGGPTISFTKEPLHSVLNFAEAIQREEMEGIYESYTMEYNFKKDVIIGYLTDHAIFANHVRRLMEQTTPDELKSIFNELVNDEEFYLVHNPYHLKHKAIRKVKQSIQTMEQRFHELLIFSKTGKNGYSN